MSGLKAFKLGVGRTFFVLSATFRHAAEVVPPPIQIRGCRLLAQGNLLIRREPAPRVGVVLIMDFEF